MREWPFGTISDNHSHSLKTIGECWCEWPFGFTQITQSGPSHIVLPQLKPMLFNKIELWCWWKLAKFMGIFSDIWLTKSREVIYWLERIRPVFPTLWSGYDISYKILQIHSWHHSCFIVWEILVRFFPVNIWLLGFWWVLGQRILPWI
jgi:hypothetical protein